MEGAKRETDRERLQRMPQVLRAYVRPIEDGRIPDSGLPDVLTFVANQLERLLAHDYDAAYREWAAKMNQLESENERLRRMIVGMYHNATPEHGWPDEVHKIVQESL